ncbi:hypothetical protein [Ectobacillus ponti]|uniref:Fibronectin type III domain-containing protein n=1 Tax=Ectobacillus ponti TaxID=2961894 RepID=A0AA41XBS4_9BACI|nr:hypothetical protein [Ectobacillus ponti]MCP8970550.1 hypothetical protein [Ectobacillus ponti]
MKKLVLSVVAALALCFGAGAADAAGLAAPRGVTTYVDFTKEIRVTWSAVYGAAGYNVYTNGKKVYVPAASYYQAKVVYYTPVEPIGTYKIYVTTVDKSGQESIPTNTLTVWVR